jgi:VanZ family protein
VFGRSGEALALWGLAAVFAATLYPFDFAFDDSARIKDLLSFTVDLTARGNDVVFGADAALSQPFRGKMGELRIFREALTPAQVEQQARSDRATLTEMPAPAASYSFAAGAGEMLRDDSGNGNHGRLVGQPQWISQEGRGGLAFDGEGQYVLVPNSPSIDVAGRSLSIAMRILLEDDSPADGVILSKPWWRGVMAPPYHQYAVEFGKLEKSVDFYFADPRGRQRGPFSVHPPIGLWTHIVFVYDGTIRGYVDGRELLAASTREFDLIDIAGNLILFVPFGFGLAIAVERRQTPLGVVTLTMLLGAAVSVGVETLQCWLPSRNPSWLDVATNSASAALGASLHFAARSEAVQRLSRWVRPR